MSGQSCSFPVTSWTVLFPQALTENSYMGGNSLTLQVPVAWARAVPQWVGTGPPAPQPQGSTPPLSTGQSATPQQARLLL